MDVIHVETDLFVAEGLFATILAEFNIPLPAEAHGQSLLPYILYRLTKARPSVRRLFMGVMMKS
jgi:hypothetical protein